MKRRREHREYGVVVPGTNPAAGTVSAPTARRSAYTNEEHRARSRALYSDPRWADLRRAQLQMFPWCQCDQCQALGRQLKASVVDHMRPHRGDEALFFDPANLRSMGKNCHDRKTAARDGGFGNAIGGIQSGCDADGRPTDPSHPWNRGKRRL